MITEAGLRSWWLELQDMEGFEDGEPPRYEVRGLADAEPEVAIEQPSSDMQITADAVLTVRVSARDDLGLNEMRLVYRLDTPDGGAEQTISLFTADDGLQTHTAEYAWQIADLHATAGTRIVFRAEATDDFDLSAEVPEGKAPPPHIGRSVTRTLSIVSAHEKAQEIIRRQEGLLDDLERAFKLQQQARDQVGELLVQIQNARSFRPEDADSLQRTELGQRDVTAQLSSPASGIERRARDLAEELANNRIDDSQTEHRLNRIADEIARLHERHLAPIEEELTQARKLVQSKLPDRGRDKVQSGERPEKALGEVADNQTAVLESLGEMLQDLSEWRAEHEALRELSELTRQQSDLNARSTEAARQTLTRPVESLAPQQRADLAKIAEKQKKHADQLEQLESRMRETVQSLESQNTDAAGALWEALEQSHDEAISGAMRDAAGEIGENHMGQAQRMQQEILRKLRDLEDTLQQKRESDTEVLVKRLRQAGEKLQELRDRQSGLLHRLDRSENSADSPAGQQALEALRQEQQALREETERLVRRLARLDAHSPGAGARRAAAQMKEAENRLSDGDPPGAADREQEALDDLEQAQRELAREEQAAREQLAREQLARAADDLAALVPRQQAVIDETRRLEELHATAGKWSRAQLVSLRDVARAQQALAEDVGRIVDRLAAAEVFARALKGAAGHMLRAAELLAERDTSEKTLQHEETARKRIIDLIEALKPEQPDSEGASPPDQQGGGTDGATPPADGIPAIAQVKMLIALQKELSARTAEIEKRRGKDGQLPAAMRDELETIAREQGELAELARNLSALATPAGNDDDEKLNPDEAAGSRAECGAMPDAGYGTARDDDGPLVPEGPAGDPKKPTDESPAEAADDELLDAVKPAAKRPADDEADRLERAINGMWNAKKRVAGADTGRQTQEIQDQVVKDLQELLALLKKQQQNRQNSPQQPNRDQGQDGNQPSNQQQKTQKGQGDPQNSAPKSEPGDGRRREGKSSDAQERTDPARSAAAEEARRVQMIKDVWGHLPPHLRTAMQNAFSENYLPKYEDLVKKYYEALAEKNRKRSAR